MRAGILRKRVEIQTATEARDAKGGVSETWTQFASVRAEVVPLIGQEYWESQRIQSSVSHAVRMRFVAGVKPKMRVVYEDEVSGGTRVLQVESVIDYREEHRELRLMCSEWVER